MRTVISATRIHVLATQPPGTLTKQDRQWQ